MTAAGVAGCDNPGRFGTALPICSGDLNPDTGLSELMRLRIRVERGARGVWRLR